MTYNFFWTVASGLEDNLDMKKMNDDRYRRMTVSFPNGEITKISIEYPAISESRTVEYVVWSAQYLFQRGWNQKNFIEYELEFVHINSYEDVYGFFKSKGWKISAFLTDQLPVIFVNNDVEKIIEIENDNIKNKTNLGIRLIIGRLTA